MRLADSNQPADSNKPAGSYQLADALASARSHIPPAEARCLLCHVLGQSAAWIEAHRDDPLPEQAAWQFCDLVARRGAGEPLAYLLGQREFYGRDFAVTPDVLIPRPETELLVDIALKKVGAGPSQADASPPVGGSEPGLRAWGATKVDAGGTGSLAYVTQTTLSVDDAAAIVAALKVRFPDIVGPKKDDICYATQNRQDAVKALAAQCDLVLVVGSRNSSNSNRLREVAEHMGVTAYLIDNASQIEPDWLAGIKDIGVTAGASAPEVLVEAIVEHLRKMGWGSVHSLTGVMEEVKFPLPREMQ